MKPWRSRDIRALIGLMALGAFAAWNGDALRVGYNAFSGDRQNVRRPIREGDRLPVLPKPSIKDLPPIVLPVFALELPFKDMESMHANSWQDQLFPGALTIQGDSYDTVRVRVRGAFARSWPKKSYKLFFDKEHMFRNRNRINLNSSWRDPAFLRETLSYRIYKECGAYSLNAEPVCLTVNGRFWGLYTAIEQPEKRYLESQGLKGAILYKANSGNNASDERPFSDSSLYRRHYEKETREEEPFDDLVDFCTGLDRAGNVKAFFETRVDLSRYVSFLCATALCQNWDGYNKNHFIGLDRKNSGKWFVIPWDLDRTLGDHWNGSFSQARLPLLLGTERIPGVTGWNRMADRFFSDPDLRKLFKERLAHLLESVFTDANMFPIIDAFRDRITALADMDREQWGSAWDSRNGIEEVKQFVRDRRIFLEREIEGL